MAIETTEVKTTETPVTPPATPATPPPAEAKPAEATPPAVEEKVSTEPKEKPAEAKAVPEKYELKLPDGSLLNPAQLEKIALTAKERGLSNEEAQGLVQERHDAVSDFVASLQEAQKKDGPEWKKRVDGYEAELKADKEFGGERLKANVEMAKRVVARFGDETLMQQLDESGYGSHPGLVKLFAKIGKAMKEDQLVLPGASAPAKKSAAEILYGDTK